MFKPTKPQHITNKAYVDNNSGGGGAEPFYFITDPLYSELLNMHVRMYD